jgi:hypothetical protein
LKKKRFYRFDCIFKAQKHDCKKKVGCLLGETSQSRFGLSLKINMDKTQDGGGRAKGIFERPDQHVDQQSAAKSTQE